MSQAQPLSTLAPEYNNQLQSPQHMTMEQDQSIFVVIDKECPPKDCKPKNPCANKECPPKECPPKNPCDDPCGQKAGYGMGYGWGWLGALILWFIIFTVLFWLIFYSLKPSFVLQSDSNQVDTAKVLLASVIASLILVIIIWLIKLAVTRRYY